MSEELAGDHRSWLERLTHFISGEPEDRDDLLELLRTAQRRQLIEQEALTMIEGVLQVSELRVRDITVPRSQMVVVPQDAEIETIFPLVAESAHSR
ncbi:MAG: magnesium/cobalt efflux protein, partial [Methylococcaceae bacterium]|nr:magnesium/cobalt efflux protein [Methylococcaceae bacterium]